jgi:FixJ family two-component response regulator
VVSGPIIRTADLSALTEAERAVACLAISGCSNQAIAAQVPVPGQSPTNSPLSTESSRSHRAQKWSPGFSARWPNDVAASAARDRRPSLRKAPDR